MKLFLIFVGIFMSVPMLSSENKSKEICIVHWHAPNYNQVARGARLQGDVKLHVSVGKDGKVSRAIVVESNADKLLQNEAIKNVTEWTFNFGEERDFETVYEYRLAAPEIYGFAPTFVTVDFPGRVHVESSFMKGMRD